MINPPSVNELLDYIEDHYNLSNCYNDDTYTFYYNKDYFQFYKVYFSYYVTYYFNLKDIPPTELNSRQIKRYKKFIKKLKQEKRDLVKSEMIKN